jgi:hypothetical protein
MSHIKNIKMLAALLLIANSNIFANNQPTNDIAIILSSSAVENNCPQKALGCFKSSNGGEIFIRTDIKSEYADVVKFGLHHDYIQFSTSKTIDPIKTCEAQVDFLIDQRKKQTAQKYSEYCSLLKQNLLAKR